MNRFWLQRPTICWVNLPFVSEVNELALQEPILIELRPTNFSIWPFIARDYKIYLVKKLSESFRCNRLPRSKVKVMILTNIRKLFNKLVVSVKGSVAQIA